MTAGELKKLLSKVPDETPVFVHSADQGCDTAGPLDDVVQVRERACITPAEPDPIAGALVETGKLAVELMERAASIDRMLLKERNGGCPIEPECELGEVARLRGQLSKNRVLLGGAVTPVGDGILSFGSTSKCCGTEIKPV